MDNNTKIKYINPLSVLVINTQGFIRQVYTPFRVQCLQQTGQIPALAWVYVDCIYEDEKDRLLYLVGGRLYPYRCFRLRIQF